MATPPKQRREKSNTYTVQDRASQEELDRLLIHDRIFTTALGGILPEQANPARFQSLLDVGCGPGGWLLEAAEAYPTMMQLCGVDISEKMLSFASARASAAHLDERVEFRVMDALRPLDFPDGSFDLLNQRFATSWLRIWEWPRLLQEYQRVTRPGGVIRITEFNLCNESSSPALVQLGNLAIDAFYQSGHLSVPQSDGLTKELPRLLSQYGLLNVQTRPYLIEYRAGTPAGNDFYEDWRRLFRNIEPFLRKWTHMPENYDEIYQQMLQEMRQPDFFAISRPLTAWGTRSPAYKEPAPR
ncbi:MAG TPA: methyltransferase domain-containing protein [Ktedonobacteraceae bacterium]